MKFNKSLFFFLAVAPVFLKAQMIPQLNAAEIKQGLDGLNVVGSVLYMAAHPDDENTRLLAYLAKEKKVRTGYLSLTRGDGGQNLIGNEQAELLGLIRTQELLAARRMDGAEQFFTRANDFGFSKNPEESFKIWGKEQILADAVWVIRKFRPDVIITRFPEDARAGHGHHSGSAILAREAFVAAADPRRFPEQLKYLKPWQAKRILWNTFNFGGNNTTAADQLKLDIGLYNNLLGKGYGEIAAESRSNHRSQGFGSARQRGPALEYFSPVAGEAAKSDLFEGIDLSWNRIKGADGLTQLIQKTADDYQVSNPAKSLPQLLKVLTALENVKDEYWKAEKTEKVKQLIVAAAGLWFESYAPQAQYAVNAQIPVTAQVLMRKGTNVALTNVSPLQAPLEAAIPAEGKLLSFEGKISSDKLSQPYWLAEKHPLGTYTINDPLLVGNPENPEPLSATFTFTIEGKAIEFKRPIVYKYTDQVRGELYEPLVIAPPVTASLSEKAFLFKIAESKTISTKLKSFKDDAKGVLEPQVPTGWKVVPQKVEFNIARKGDEQTQEFTITPDKNAAGGTLSMHVLVDGQTYDKGLRVVAYEHIPVQTLFPAAEARLDQVDLKMTGKHIAYIAGAGDLVPESLKQIGYDVTSLTDLQVINTDLSGYDAIVTGVRLYNVNDQIKYMQPKLMKYVENGGTLLVQYNVNTPLKIDNIGPYPFKLSRDRTTEEDALVTVLQPQNPVLNYPNKITAKDFDGWIQERGLYFLTDIDSHYTPVLSMHDQGDAERNGSLIVTNYGKGRYVYTGISFFRQLPAGVPGAYRLFVNLISAQK
ncbi:PIG-L family deacetylase [Pedobacter sp. MC2016-24]|uniref:PIG-L family deacetylase n=1 Tax=Pedobacter sp. MC2016-24 TaxID=2780090 RepID=UPI001881967D|nr:PIG-L family deacetylase [Pedobacter sp. MC2016-24]MBE9601818.1 PIG-L family deacetylase [Pedobacter sp. MC2016-24]